MKQVKNKHENKICKQVTWKHTKKWDTNNLQRPKSEDDKIKPAVIKSKYDEIITFAM